MYKIGSTERTALISNPVNLVNPVSKRRGADFGFLCLAKFV
jgi:hypothetical protein